MDGEIVKSAYDLDKLDKEILDFLGGPEGFTGILINKMLLGMLVEYQTMLGFEGDNIEEFYDMNDVKKIMEKIEQKLNS